MMKFHNLLLAFVLGTGSLLAVAAPAPAAQVSGGTARSATAGRALPGGRNFGPGNRNFGPGTRFPNGYHPYRGGNGYRYGYGRYGYGYRYGYGRYGYPYRYGYGCRCGYPYGYGYGYGYPYGVGVTFGVGYGYVGGGYGYAPYPAVYGRRAYWARRPYWRPYRRAYFRRPYVR